MSPNDENDNLDSAKEAAGTDAVSSNSPENSSVKTPSTWRWGILAGITAIGFLAYLLRDFVGLRGQSIAGLIFFFGVVAAFSRDLKSVKWSTIYWGIGLQLALAIIVLRVRMTVGGTEYSVQNGLNYVGEGFKAFTACADAGAEFVFGNLANTKERALEGSLKDGFKFPFAFRALPPILFISAFFTLLYHLGVLQRIVRLFAKIMVHLMGTSGAETLSVSANVFMGQTEAPLIVKPYIPRMTNSELFALMASGMAHISGGMMAIYIGYGADPAAVIATCVMACPCSLYLSKLFMPEINQPETSGLNDIKSEKSPYINSVDAISSGTSDGLRLALNVAAMLIVFIAFVALINALLGLIPTAGLGSWAPAKLSLEWIFGKLFSPLAFLMGVDGPDRDTVGSLLGTKLCLNEHYAYLQLKELKAAGALSPRSLMLCSFALTGFANFSSVGIQLGGIGAMAPGRRSDLARLGMKALFVGFIATLLNAALAGLLMI